MEPIPALIPLLAILFGLVIAAVNMKLIASMILSYVPEQYLGAYFPKWTVRFIVWCSKLGERHEPS